MDISITTRMQNAVVSHKSVGAYNVVAYREGSCRVWPHKTLKAAFRRLGSVENPRGKLYDPLDHNIGIVLPKMEVVLYR